MSAWRAIGLVWWREIVTRGTSKAFLIASGLTLLLLTGVFIGPRLIPDEPEELKIGHVGAASEPIVATALVFAQFEDDVMLEAIAFDTLEGAEMALEAGDIEALLVDDRELVTLGQGSFSNNRSASMLQEAAAANAIEALVADTGMAPEEVVGLLTSRPLEPRTLSGFDADDPIREIVAYAGLMLMYAAILMYGTWTLSGVTEEKANRVVEILISTVRPWHLLAGKVGGIGSLALVQFGLTVAYGLFLAGATGAVEIANIPVDSAAMVLLWFVLGFTIYAVMFAVVGSLVSRTEDAQSASTPVTIAAVASFMVTFVALNDPDGLTAQIATFVPFTAPYVVPVRFSLDAIAWWEVAASVAVTLVVSVLLIRLAGRIYRGALLSYGARLKLRDAWASGTERRPA